MSTTPFHSTVPSIFDCLPAELIREVCDHLLAVSNTPRTYGYTGPVEPSPAGNDNSSSIQHSLGPLRRHGMLLVNKQVSLAYRQCFYERTNFFFRIDSQNAFSAVPLLSRDLTLSAPKPGPPDFWGAPDVLVQNLRHCTLFIELGEIASHPSSLHSFSTVTRAKTTGIDQRQELKTYSCLNDIHAQDSTFDSAITSAILTLLAHMQQLRSVQFVWDTTSSKRRAWHETTKWTWESFGERVVKALKKKVLTREMRVKVGDIYADETWWGRKEDGLWSGEFVRRDGPRLTISGLSDV